MKIVIDIPEDDYEYIKDEWNIDNAMVQSNVIASIMNGTPLPKGHGRLIDADAFISFIKDVSQRHEYENLRVDGIITVNDVLEAVIGSLQNEGLSEGNAPTIIEADTESEE